MSEILAKAIKLTFFVIDFNMIYSFNDVFNMLSE